MHNFQAMMLKGSELETVESRAKFRFETRFRVLPKNYGVYDGEKVFDVDEIVVATDTLPLRGLHRGAAGRTSRVSIFWNNSWFERRQSAADTVIRREASEWSRAMRHAMENATPGRRRLLDDFVRRDPERALPDARGVRRVLFARRRTSSGCSSGEIGDNLMYRYRAMASFFIWPDICRVAMNATRELLVERGADRAIVDFSRLWNDFHAYVLHKHPHGTTREQLLAPTSDTLHYDIAGWVAAGMPHDPIPFRLRPLRSSSSRSTPRRLASWTI